MFAHRRHLPFALLFLAAFGCSPEPGANGPVWNPPREAEGPCWEVDLAEGFDDLDAWPALFACFNRHGAFEPLEALVLHAATSTTVEAAVDAAAATFPEFDLLDALEVVLRWQGSPDNPVPEALALYAEAYERGLFPPALGLLREVSDATLRCETSAAPEACSLPRLVRRARREGTFDGWRAVFDAVHGDAPEAVRARHQVILAAFLRETSTRGLERAVVWPGRIENQLLGLARHLVKPRPEGTAFEQLLPHLQFFLAPGARDDGFAERLVEHLAPVWKRGTLSKLPEMLEVIYTTTSTGGVVGFGGRSIADELLAGAERLTGLESLLRQEFTLDEAEGPVTILELALDSVDGLYESGGGIPEVLEELESLRRILCTGARPRALCRLMTEILPAARAAVRTGIGEIALPVLYVVHREVEMDRLFDLVEAVLDLELLDATRFLVQRAIELEALDAALDLFPTLVDVELGRLRAPGAELLRWARWAAAAPGEGEPVPLRVLVPVLERLLDPENPGADVDRLLGSVGALLLEPESAWSWGALSAFDDRWTRASDAIGLDLSDELGRAVDDVRLVDALVALGRDTRLIGLLTPIPGREGAPGYLYDLVREGRFERVLVFVAELLGLVKGEGEET